MIRILHVIGAMDRGGAETLIMNLYRTLNKNTFQFDFLVHEKIECDYDQEILDLGGKIFRLDRFTGTNYLQYKKQCETFFNEHPEYKIVHGHIGSSAPIYIPAAKRAGCYTIAHSHSQKFAQPLYELTYSLVNFPTRYLADYYFACSQKAGVDRYGKKVSEGDRFAVLNNGVDLSQYSFDEGTRHKTRDSLSLEDRPVFGHVGRFAIEKNHEFLLRVFKEIQKDIPNAALLLCGRGPLEESMKQLAEDLELNSSVFFLGVRDDVSCLLMAMDVFLFPSFREGLGLAAIEAQATGLPCLLSTGVPEAAVVTPHVERLPLDAGASKWAEQSVKAYETGKTTDRKDAFLEVKRAGFDIVDITRSLEYFYLDKEKAKQ